jgi:hypothetical protein
MFVWICIRDSLHCSPSVLRERYGQTISIHVIQPLPPYADPGTSQAFDLVQYVKEMAVSSDKTLREVAGDNAGEM